MGHPDADSMDTSTTFRPPTLAIFKPKEKALSSSADERVPVGSLCDEALMNQIKCGSGEPLSVLFGRYARLVRAVAYRILQDESEADDVLQEVFLFIHRRCELFDSAKSSARSWIVQVTYHRAIDQRRYLQSRHFYTQVELEGVIGGLRDERHKPDLTEFEGVWRLFYTLSNNQRQTLELFFFEGLTLNEIALKLGQTRGNVKNHYFRGLEKLRKQLPHRNSPPRSGV